jgi:hypothetical protein
MLATRLELGETVERTLEVEEPIEYLPVRVVPWVPSATESSLLGSLGGG